MNPQVLDIQISLNNLKPLYLSNGIQLNWISRCGIGLNVQGERVREGKERNKQI